MKLMQLNAQRNKHSGHEINHSEIEGAGREIKEYDMRACVFNVCKLDLLQLTRFIRIDRTDYEARNTLVLN